MIESTKTAPCASCGGGAGCQCGGAGCAVQAGECRGGPLQRPLFFPGQLLTEDDLQLLSDYTAAKSRLHNRFLHGDGVICGLLVACHPCGGGKVIVQAGSALDCCGNHVIVPCPVELDINEMVQALRVEKRAGYDCGDPCAKECADSPDDVRCVERRGRRYCLHLQYCEVEEEPVAPYVTKGDCSVQECRPTRLREGYRFELRCPDDEPEPDDVWRRVRACIGDLRRADQAADKALGAHLYYRRAQAVLPLVELGRVPAFQGADVEQLEAGIEALTPLLRPAKRKGAEATGADEWREEDVRRLLDAYQSTAAAVLRYDLQPPEAAKAAAAPEGARETVAEARELLAATAAPLRKLADEKLTSARDRLIASVWIAQGREWTSKERPRGEPASRELLLYAHNAPYARELQQQLKRDLADLRDWLLERLEHKALVGDCRLRRDVLAIDLPADQLSRRDAETALRLIHALLRYLRECICAALNPPCRPCEDATVKLACLTVDDCEVVEICNLERTFVLSAPALRYWVPFLHSIGELFERFCCEPLPWWRTKDEREARGEIAELDRAQTFMVQAAPAHRHLQDQPELGALLRIVGIDAKALRTAVDFGGNLGALALGAPDGAAALLRLVRPDVGARVADAAGDVLAARPQLRAALVGPVERDLAELKRRVDEGAVVEEALGDAVDQRIGARLEEVSEQVAKMVADANRASAKTIRDLKAALQKQEKRNDELEERLARLEGGQK